MGKNYEVLHYIRHQVNKYYNRDDLYNILARCFQNVEDNREPDGCLSNSVAIYFCLKEYGYEPTLCYGLCSVEKSEPFYHVWVELNKLVIDIAIYGNINYSRLLASVQKVKYPIVLEQYNGCYADYQKFCFDDDWKSAQISAAENRTLMSYVERSPSGLMYRLISKLMGEPSRNRAQQMVKKYGNIRLSDFRDSYEGGSD